MGREPQHGYCGNLITLQYGKHNSNNPKTAGFHVLPYLSLRVSEQLWAKKVISLWDWWSFLEMVLLLVTLV